MPKENQKIEPRTFYLNEYHELARAEKGGGGGIPKYDFVDWATKGKIISQSLGEVKRKLKSSKDPLREQRYFLLATPLRELTKKSENKKKAPTGTFVEETNYADDHSRVFSRLGLDLIQVNDDGTATVHARPERVDQLILTTESLSEAGLMEQSRWATVDSFDVMPPQLRVDKAWLATLPSQKPTDAVVEMQPLLSTVEIDILLRAIATLLKKERGEGLVGTGSDFSGRQWLRGRLTRESLQAIAQTFFRFSHCIRRYFPSPSLSLHHGKRKLPGSTTEKGTQVPEPRRSIGGCFHVWLYWTQVFLRIICNCLLTSEDNTSMVTPPAW